MIIATGAKPLVLPISGIETSGVLHAIDVLDGKVACGEKVLIIGGGMVGSETAAFLGELGHKVTVVELREDVAKDVIPEHRKFLMKDFDEYKIDVIANAKVSNFTCDGVSYTLPCDTTKQLEGFDSVVLAMGARAYNPLVEEISKLIPDTFVIGDAKKVRRALDATKEALEVAMAI